MSLISKSLTPITDRVAVIPGTGYAAGVLDRSTAAAHGWDYDKIYSFFGPESNGYGVTASRMRT